MPVLPSGPDVASPASARPLYERIVETGQQRGQSPISAGLALGFTAMKARFVERLELGASGKLQLTGQDERHELEVR